jgi:hypothetical protein
MQLLVPSLTQLSAYPDALARGWSPNNVRDVSGEQLDATASDREAFVASLLDQGGTVKLPGGSEVPKLPSRVRWMWDGEFAGIRDSEPGRSCATPSISCVTSRHGRIIETCG